MAKNKIYIKKLIALLYRINNQLEYKMAKDPTYSNTRMNVNTYKQI